MHIAANRERHGFLDGAQLDQFAGCLDVDPGFTPATNTLPIRRLDLEVGTAADVVATWLQFPGLVVKPLKQRYSRLGETTCRYESASGFVATLEVDALGLVTSYEGLWERLH